MESQSSAVEALAVNHWLDRPVFVTGATGLVGGWLLQRLLAAQAAPVCLVRDQVPRSEAASSGALNRCTVVRGDLADRDLLERALNEYSIDTVFHLAAQTIVGTAQRHPVSTFESNVAGTWNLLEACRRSPSVQAIVVASSDKAYGAAPELPYVETDALAGRYPYDVSKSCADLVAQSYGVTYQLPVAITRCGNFYGGGDLNWNRIVPGTIRSVLRNEAPVIRSNGEFVRDYLYVEDGVAAYLLLAEKLRSQPALSGRAFNISAGAYLSVCDLVRQILSTMGSKLSPAVLDEASNEIERQYLSAERAKHELGWRPQYTLSQGLGVTVEWYRHYFGGTGDDLSARGFTCAYPRTR